MGHGSALILVGIQLREDFEVARKSASEAQHKFTNRISPHLRAKERIILKTAERINLAKEEKNESEKALKWTEAKKYLGSRTIIFQQSLDKNRKDIIELSSSAISTGNESINSFKVANENLLQQISYSEKKLGLAPPKAVRNEAAEKGRGTWEKWVSKSRRPFTKAIMAVRSDRKHELERRLESATADFADLHYQYTKLSNSITKINTSLAMLTDNSKLDKLEEAITTKHVNSSLENLIRAGGEPIEDDGAFRKG